MITTILICFVAFVVCMANLVYAHTRCAHLTPKKPRRLRRKTHDGQYYFFYEGDE